MVVEAKRCTYESAEYQTTFVNDVNDLEMDWKISHACVVCSSVFKICGNRKQWQRFKIWHELKIVYLRGSQSVWLRPGELQDTPWRYCRRAATEQQNCSINLKIGPVQWAELLCVKTTHMKTSPTHSDFLIVISSSIRERVPSKVSLGSVSIGVCINNIWLGWNSQEVAQGFILQHCPIICMAIGVIAK